MPQHRLDDRKAVTVTLGRAALGAALAGISLCATMAAARAGDDDSFLAKLERTVGLKSPNTMEYGINYSERSPLVVPPTRDLPAPESAGPPPVPDWPKDQDIRKREQANVKERVVPHADYVIDSSRALRPDELNAGGGHVSGGTPSPGSSNASLQDDRYSKNAPKNFFSFDWFKKKQEYATFTGEPARESLTEPPPGYQTPSPDQPYGIGPETKPYHVPTAAEHGEPSR